MKKLFNIKNTIGVILIVTGLFLAVKHKKSNLITLDINKPTNEIISYVTPISKLVTDSKDKIKLAIFNQEFATRILSYNINNQQTNDIYVIAASDFFQNELLDKYQDLDVELIKLIQSSIGIDNHILTNAEKKDLSDKCMGLAWSLIESK